jgi:hypothetical protein
VVARRKIAETTGLTAEVTVVFPKSIEGSVGEAKRVLDLRSHPCPAQPRPSEKSIV